MMFMRNYKVEDKGEINLMRESWDYLIVLDACRYDYFEKLFPHYLEGRLRFAVSPASDTRDWIEKTFGDRYDGVVYISANPHINSAGLDIANIGFDPREHFSKIVDVWDFGWNNELGTVPPEKVNDAAVAAKLIHPDKRLIIHYLQPHAPYLPPADQSLVQKVLRTHELGLCASFLTNRITRAAWSVLAASPSLCNLVIKIRAKISEKTRFRPIDIEVKRRGKAGLLTAYQNNLKRVLESIRDLLNRLPPGETVVTADHGELLGENNEWGHRPNHHALQLLAVPYLEIGKRKI